MAAKKTPAEAGREFLTAVLQHVPEAQRAAVSAAFQADQAAAALGEGVLGRAESSRLFSEVQAGRAESARIQAEGIALHNSNRKWYEDNVRALGEAAAAREMLKQRGFDDATLPGALGKMVAATKRGRPADDDDDDAGDSGDGRMRGSNGKFIDPSKLITSDNIAGHVRALTASTAQGLQSLAVTIPTLIAQHGAEFHEVLDIHAVEAYRTQYRLADLPTAYHYFVKGKRDEAAQALQVQRDAKLVEDTRKAVIDELRTQGVVYPVGGYKPEDLGPLDAVIAAGADRSGFGAEQAARFYLDKTGGGRAG